MPTSGSLGSNIATFILEVLLWFVEIPLIGIANVLIDIFGGLGTGAGSTASDIFGFLGKIFVQTESSFSSLGIFAPIAAAGVWGVAVLILVFFIFKAIQLAMAETTEDV